jgi:hypothetical protein
VTSRKDGLRVYYQVGEPQLFKVIDEMISFLRLTGKWQPQALEKETPRLPCTCPQCTDEQLHIQIEVSHA